MEIFIKIVQFVAIISVLVILHELGHFIPAKLFKTKVEKFYLFFDPWFSVVKKKIGDTEYGIGWLPFGGYVKIAGMMDESMDEEQLKQPVQPHEFRAKPAWQRLIIMIGGVVVNFFLAWIIYSTMLVVNGESYIPINKVEHGLYVDASGEKLGLKTGDKIVSVDGKPLKKFKKAYLDLLLGDEAVVLRDGKEINITLTDEGKKAVLESKGKRFLTLRRAAIIGEIGEKSIAEKAGLLKGDVIKSINGTQITFWHEVQETLPKYKNSAVNLEIERNGKIMSIQATLDKDGVLGVGGSIAAIEKLLVHDTYSVGASIPEGFNRTISVLTDQVKQFKLIFNSKVQGYKQVKGPIGIIEQMPASWDWNFFWGFMAMFSVWLAFLNILPIPALDGGHVMFLLYEMIAGKAPSENVLKYGQIVGFVLLMGIMVLVIGHDIVNLFK